MKIQVDILFIMAAAFTILLSFAVANILWSNLKGTQLYNITNQAMPSVIQSTEKSLNIFNNAIVLIYFAFCLASIILAFFTETSPIFSIFVFLLIPIQLLVSFVFHDLFVALTQDSNFAFLLNNNLIAGLFLNLPIITFIINLILIIILYSK
jgi:hypothetical protein